MAEKTIVRMFAAITCVTLVFRNERLKSNEALYLDIRDTMRRFFIDFLRFLLRNMVEIKWTSKDLPKVYLK